MDDLILQAVTEKLHALKSPRSGTQTSPLADAQPSAPVTASRLCRKEGILVINVEPAASFDINALLDELREERIWDQMAL